LDTFVMCWLIYLFGVFLSLVFVVNGVYFWKQNEVHLNKIWKDVFLLLEFSFFKCRRIAY
jgi:hypothetical protein